MIDQQDQDVYDEVSSAYADVRLERDAEDVIKRGRTLRRRRRTMPALAAATVLAFSLSLAAVTAQTHRSAHVAVVNVDEAGFSVHTNPKTGVVTVTIRQLEDENQLNQILAEAGIPAVFHSERIQLSADVLKHWKPAPAYRNLPPAVQACFWTGARILPESVIDNGMPLTGEPAKIATIDPRAMPPGSVIGFDYITVVGWPSGAYQIEGFTLLSNMPTGCVRR
jgi:hypothetical protein